MIGFPVGTEQQGGNIHAVDSDFGITFGCQRPRQPLQCLRMLRRVLYQQARKTGFGQKGGVAGRRPVTMASIAQDCAQGPAFIVSRGPSGRLSLGYQDRHDLDDLHP